MQSVRSTSGNHESRSHRKRFFHFWRCFWLSFLVLSLGFAWYCYYAPTNTVAWAENLADAQSEARRSEKPMLLFFTGKWCVPCRIMKRKVWADEHVAASVNSRFVPVSIDVGNPDDASILARYKVVGSPVTIVTDPQGNVLRWRDGAVEKSEFLEFLEASNSSVNEGTEPK